MRNLKGIFPRVGRVAVLAALGVSTLALAATGTARAADAGPACKVSTRQQTITRMGRSPFVKGGVTTREGLAALFDKDKDAIACVLEQHGLERLEGALAEAAGGSAVTERDLRSDECFDWMAWRNRKGVAISGPLCLKVKKTYGTYEVPVDEMIAETLPEVRCEIQASGDAAAKPPTLNASINGSTPGATASWTSTNGTSGDLTGSGPWTMEWKDLCTADYTFTVKDTDQGTQTWVTHSFLVPKICANLSYAGVSAPRTVPGKSDECTSSVEVKRFVPPPPAVQLSVTPTKGETGETIVAQSSADSVCLKSCDAFITSSWGAEIDRAGCGPWEKVFWVPGVYTYRAKAEDAIGQTGEAGPISVRIHPRWTVRGFGAFVDPKDDAIMTSRFRTPSQPERTAWSLEKGWGIGGTVERRFSETVGLEGGLILSQVQSSAKLDLGTAWAIAKKKVGLNLLTIGPNFHVLHEPGRADLYVGPFLGYALFNGKSYGVLGESLNRDLDDKLGFGVQIGLDLPIHRAAKGIWNFHTGLRYMDLSTDVDLGVLGSKSVSVDPLILSAGLSYSF
ncbi:MAG TPA: OmpW family outer membrane protein [Thermoanaerobaculia bacterium]|nr:OmpW family outer membrane protein [Thermoanaerobaculia bacterium]